MIIPVFIPQEGCPHQCVFCNQETISGQKEQGLLSIRKQIEKYLAWAKPKEDNELAFYGGTFTGLTKERQKEYLSLANEYREKGKISNIRLSTRPDYISHEILKTLKEYGVKTVELGVQSLDDGVLSASGRGHSVKDVIDAVNELKAFGFVVGIQLMVGLPKQDFLSFQKTVDIACSLKPFMVRIYPLLVIKDTPLEKMYEEGKYSPLTIEKAVEETYYAYNLFKAAGIKVIRMGLQPDDNLCAKGNIVAGPFHPSFGEMVRSYGYRIKVDEFLNSISSEEKSIVVTHTLKETSMVRGINKSNVDYWREKGIKVDFVLGEKFSVETKRN